MSDDSNPYRSPANSVETLDQDARRNIRVSVFMIIVGSFFFVLHCHLMLGAGIDFLLSSYRTLGWFSFGWGVFYGFAGGFISFFHVSYLVRGRPTQSTAGIYSIAIALCLAGLAVAVMEYAV